MNEKIIRSAVGTKALSTGRIVVINNPMYRNNLGVILKKDTGPKSQENTFWVYVLTAKEQTNGNRG